MPAAGDLEDQLTPSEGLGQHDRVHGCQRAARGEADLVGVETPAEQLRRLDLQRLRLAVLKPHPRGERRRQHGHGEQRQPARPARRLRR